MIPQKKINFKQPKYILPAILYFPLLGLGYLFIDIFHTEIPEDVQSDLQTTEYLNPELPSANVRDDLGGKRENVEKTFGNIRDLSAMENIENDLDSVKKKEGFESNYTEKDLEELAKNAKSKAEHDRYMDMRNKLQQQAGDARDQSGADFVKAHKRAEKQLSDDSVSIPSAGISATVTTKKRNAVNAINDDEEAVSVVKKVRDGSDYFNTLSVNEKESNLIKAIVDEDVKAVEGSRVRLRLLDDIEVNDIVLKKNSYLYCIMSGFGSQRVKGRIESVMIDDRLEKVSLAIFDLDGLEGLYVPESRFRETAKDVSSQALQSNMNVTDGMTTNTSFVSWASNAMQNGYQRVANAISKNIRKNKAKIKYGTQVYLVNSAQKRGGFGGGRKTAMNNQRNSDQGADYNIPPAIRNLRTNGGTTVPRPTLRSYGNAVGQ